MVPHRFRNSIISCKTFPGADCGSDHVPVISEIRVKLKTLSKSKKNPKLQVSLLKSDLSIKEKFRIKIQNRFEALSEIPETEKMWEELKSSITAAAEEVIPKVQMNKKSG